MKTNAPGTVYGSQNYVPNVGAKKEESFSLRRKMQATGVTVAAIIGLGAAEFMEAPDHDFVVVANVKEAKDPVMYHMVSNGEKIVMNSLPPGGIPGKAKFHTKPAKNDSSATLYVG